LQEANRVLKKGSVLINSEPDLEGAIYKSIFFEDIDDIIDNFQFKKFKEEKGETKFKFRLFSREEIKTLLKQAGFKTTAYHGLSLLPSILRIKMVREEFSADEISARENEIRTIFDYFNQNGSLFKHIIWKSIKQ
jgi:hypothetical protein